MTTAPLNVLRIDSSGRKAGSVTRALTDRITARLQSAPGGARLAVRDVSAGLPVVTEDWIGANFTAPDERTDVQKARLGQSDALVDELQAADVLVIGMPVYNFGIPAALKSWVDMVARVGRTFHYTADGPVGLLSGKRAIVAFASGGTPIGSGIDFASGYMRHVLGFIGITDVEFVTGEEAVDALAA